MKLKILYILVFSLILFSCSAKEKKTGNNQDQFKIHDFASNKKPVDKTPPSFCENWEDVEPQGQLLFDINYMGREFEFNLDEKYSYYALVSKGGVPPTHSSLLSKENYAESNRYMIKRCNLSVIKDKNEDWRDYSLKFEESDSLGHVVFLLSGIDLPENKEVNTSFEGILHSWTQEGREQSYEFNTTNGVLKVYPDTTFYDSTEYCGGSKLKKLVYVAEFQNKKSVLIKDLCYGAISVIWVGDLDCDGIPDILVDVSRKETKSIYLLLISSIAKEADLYGLAGKIIIYGC